MVLGLRRDSLCADRVERLDRHAVTTEPLDAVEDRQRQQHVPHACHDRHLGAVNVQRLLQAEQARRQPREARPLGDPRAGRRAGHEVLPPLERDENEAGRGQPVQVGGRGDCERAAARLPKVLAPTRHPDVHLMMVKNEIVFFITQKSEKGVKANSCSVVVIREQ